METDDASSMTTTDSVDHQKAALARLPSEIIFQVLCYLPCQSLVSLSRTCRRLRGLASNDFLWADLLRPNIPPEDFPADPYPSSSYRDLYITHHPYWFVPRNKIWISDEPHIGRVMICHFDPRRGCIEGYRLLAERTPSMGLLWPYEPSVVIHNFNPRVHLWLDDPILKLPHDIVPFNTRQGWWEAEIKMTVGRPGHNTSASFFLSRDIPPHLQNKSMDLWPPRTIPNMPRVRAASVDKFRGSGHKPQKYDQISQTTFRLRHWSQFSTGMAHFGIRIGEEVSTWSTIDPALYTPTKEKPYQGIFVGDYAGHGCEFLLVMQSEKGPEIPQRRPTDAYLRGLIGLPPESEEDELEEPVLAQQTDEQLSQSQSQYQRDMMAMHEEEGIYKGSIQAVKLTGDPHVPRGEYTFVADDIGPGGLIRIAEEQPFRGSRVVRSRGHVAARGFQNDEFIPSQLIMVSPNKLAQYWVPYGHISFYQRIDLDRLIDDTFRGGHG
ncbi:hypothetical protein, variant [Cladophialophora immunda]|uniref:F-box domain-containing protein n=1 Tax=Cladophialophora immunda TaxID=569365 RepID=A0A0D2CHK6_9EURO|nr:uncharacterized protein PV07_06322 [Cladophialophora immunda]XP_016250804.1 hypothetical protein, variant [Cladophialophora immunda]KIW30587.1 hypothetical protein PV07_06322 [Cladophialophora immunda]KIW30588.1 hypothetical protein, variant [Cladophialophora immunda]